MVHGREQLKDWLDRRGFNQREAAEFLSMDFTMLNQILTGRRNPGLATAVNLERLTGVAVDAWVPTDVDGSADAEPAPARKRK